MECVKAAVRCGLTHYSLKNCILPQPRVPSGAKLLKGYVSHSSSLLALFFLGVLRDTVYKGRGRSKSDGRLAGWLTDWLTGC